MKEEIKDEIKEECNQDDIEIMTTNLQEYDSAGDFPSIKSENKEIIQLNVENNDSYTNTSFEGVTHVAKKELNQKTSENNVQIREVNNNNPPFHCEKCNKTFTKEWILTNHNAVFHQSNLYGVVKTARSYHVGDQIVWGGSREEGTKKSFPKVITKLSIDKGPFTNYVDKRRYIHGQKNVNFCPR